MLPVLCSSYFKTSARLNEAACIRVPFHEQNQGLPAAFCSRIQAIARSLVSSSTVSMRFLVSGPEGTTGLGREAGDDANACQIKRFASHAKRYGGRRRDPRQTLARNSAWFPESLFQSA